MYVRASRRLLALLLDTVVVSGIFFTVLFIMKALFSVLNGDLSLSTVSSAAHSNLELPSNWTAIDAVYHIVVLASIWFLYEFIFVNSCFSATPGKAVLEMEIACYNGASTSKVVVRSLLKIVSLFSLIGCVVEYITINVQVYRQSLHDLAASTLVSNKEKKTDVESMNAELILDEFEKGKLDDYNYILELKSRVSANRESVNDTRSYAGISWAVILLAFLVASLFVLLNMKII